MSLWKRIFGSKRMTTDGEALYRQGVALFGQNKFPEALRLLEQAAGQLPNSAAVFFTLGATYSRAAPAGGEQARRPWVEKSVDAFRRSIQLHREFGGLNEKQLATAMEIAGTWSNSSNARVANGILHAMDRYGIADPETILREVRKLGTRDEIYAALDKIEKGIESGELQVSYTMGIALVMTIRQML